MRHVFALLALCLLLAITSLLLSEPLLTRGTAIASLSTLLHSTAPVTPSNGETPVAAPIESEVGASNQYHVRAAAPVESQMLFVNEVIPRPLDGGGIRAHEVLRLASHAFDAQPWMVARSPPWVGSAWSPDELGDDLGAHLLSDDDPPSSEASNATPIFGVGFQAPTGSTQRMANFPALVERVAAEAAAARAAHGNGGNGNGHHEDGEAHAIRLALLFMWSFHIAPGGDSHWTIPEIFLPLVREHLPGVCAVVVADDLQHERFRVEAALSPSSARRLEEREMAAYASPPAARPRRTSSICTYAARHLCFSSSR